VTKVFGDTPFTNVLTHFVGTGAVTYASSAPAVVTVDANGQVIVIGVGQTTITATAGAMPGVWLSTSESYALTVQAKAITQPAGLILPALRRRTRHRS